jgi:hypothetical protein
VNFHVTLVNRSYKRYIPPKKLGCNIPENKLTGKIPILKIGLARATLILRPDCLLKQKEAVCNMPKPNKHYFGFGLNTLIFLILLVYHPGRGRNKNLLSGLFAWISGQMLQKVNDLIKTNLPLLEHLQKGYYKRSNH